MQDNLGRTVVLFMVDQLAAHWLEVAQDGVVDLPNFDSLRSESVTFTRAYSTNPVCSPSRASIATGMSNSGHGVTETGYTLDPNVTTFMSRMQSSGWRTGAFGKLHFIPQIETLQPDYYQYGFDEVCNTEDSRAGEWLDWVKETYPEHYEAALSTVWMTMVPGLTEYGPDREDLRARVFAAQQRYPDSTTNAYALPFPVEVSQTAWITDQAIEFIRGTSGDLFAHISYVQPHNPFTPPREFLDRVNVDAIPEPLPAEWFQEPIAYYEQPRYATPTYQVDDWRRERSLYFADLAHLDHELGRVRAALKEAGRLEDALFVFTSDHGEMLHDHGLVGKFERHYDACIRVPLIVSAPGVQAGENPRLVEHTDIAATIYAWTGIAPPTATMFSRTGDDQQMGLLHGKSLLRSSERYDDREYIYIQSNNSPFDPTPKSWARTIRTSRFRYTVHLHGGGEQLFDLIEDPAEQRNLAYDEASRDVRRKLIDQLTEAMALDSFPNSPRQLYKVGSW